MAAAAAAAAIAKTIATTAAGQIVGPVVEKITGQFDIMFGGVVIKLEEKTRPISVILINKSGGTLAFRRNWFDSGRVWNAWNEYELGPEKASVAYFSNSDGGIMTGVSGLSVFEMDDGCWYYLGFSNPFAGSYKMCCHITRKQPDEVNLNEVYDTFVQNSSGKNTNQYATSFHMQEGIPRITVVIKEAGLAE